MKNSEKRKVGERGQITIPKQLRERLGISHGDEVVVQEKDGKLMLEASVREKTYQKATGSGRKRRKK